MKVNISNDKVNIEDLTYRQFALVYEAIKYASNQGGYQIDIDDLDKVMEGFKDINIKEFFDLDLEKKIIEEKIAAIMKRHNYS